MPDGSTCDEITDELINSLKKEGLSDSMIFLAQQQRSRYPYLPVHTKDEMALFKRAISAYLGSKKDPDLKRMAADWNSGSLAGSDGKVVDGKTIFRKTEGMLRRHFNGPYKSSSARRFAERGAPESLAALEEFLLENWVIEEDADEVLESIRAEMEENRERIVEDASVGDASEQENGALVAPGPSGPTTSAQATALATSLEAPE